MRAFKAIAAIVPGPAVLFVTQWLNLFAATNLTSPEWQTSAEQLSIAGGSFVAVTLSILLRDAQKARLKLWAWIGFVLTLACLGACWCNKITTPRLVRAQRTDAFDGWLANGIRFCGGVSGTEVLYQRRASN
jgi:hypothetical protein